MNLTDLGAELQARAAEATVSAAQPRIAGVRARVRTRRRRQAGAFAAVVAACVVVVGLTPISGNLLAHRQQSPSSHSKPKHPNPFVFDDVHAGDPLTVSLVGKRGQRDVQMVFTPRDTNLSMSTFCDLKDEPDKTESNLMAWAALNGHRLVGSGCGGGSSANSTSGDFGTTPSERRAWMARRGVYPGKPAVLRITLMDNKNQPKSSPKVLLGVGLYEMSAPTVTSQGVVIPELAENYPHDYVLVTYRTLKITRTTRSLTLAVPKAGAAGWVAGGSMAPDSTHEEAGTMVLRIGSQDDGVTTVEGGGAGSGEIGPAASTAQVKVTGSITGTMWVAYYRRID